MALGALVMIIIAFSYAYMVPKYPKTGGEFTFIKMCFGRNTAYVRGWFLVVAYLTNVPMNSTAIGLIVDGLDGSADILKWGLHYQVAGVRLRRPHCDPDPTAFQFRYGCSDATADTASELRPYLHLN